MSVVTLIDWMRSAALPLWADAGWDDEAGSFIERLSLNGAPQPGAPRRAMVQARQIYVYALAHRRGWMDGADVLALRAARAMTERYAARDGGWLFSLDRGGGVIDARRDFYAQAFVLLALAEAFRLSGDAGFLDLADATLDFLDARMASPHGGYLECWPPAGGARRQNPHMHLYEALIALHEVAPARAYLDRADALRRLCLDRFLHGDGAILVEFFGDDWTPADGPDFPFEPGHHFEWIWLLARHARLRGEATPAVAGALWRAAVAAGVADDGGVCDRARLSGPVTRATRLWPHAEAAKAACFMGDPARASDLFLHRLHERFLRPAAAGGWIDAFDESGAPAVSFIPASSLYHIACALDAVLTETDKS